MTIRPAIVVCLSAMTCLACVDPALANDQFDGASVLNRKLPWAAALPAGAFGRACVGDFTGDLYPDVVTLREVSPGVSEAVLVFGPGQYMSNFADGLLARDVCTFEASQPGGRDSLFYVTGSGLYHATFEYDAQSGGGFWSTDWSNELEPWNTATRVVVGQRHSSTVIDLIGTDGTDVWVNEDALGSTATTMLVDVMDPVSAVLDLVTLDWSAASDDREVVILAPDGLRVFTLGGALVTSFPNPNWGGFLASFHDNSCAYDRVLGVVQPQGQSTHWLYLGDVNGAESLNLGQLYTVGVATGDVDNDANGDDDLALYLNTPYPSPGGPLLPFSFNDPGASFTFPLAPPNFIDLPDQTLLASGWPVLLDGDLDGDLDLLLPVAENSADELWLLENLQVLTGEPEADDQILVVTEALYEHTSNPGTLTLTVDQAPAVTGGLDEVEITIWKNPDFTKLPTEGGGNEQVAVYRDIQPALSYPLPITASLDLPENDDLFAVQLRLVDTDVGGYLVAANATMTMGLALTTQAYTHLATTVGVSELEVEVEFQSSLDSGPQNHAGGMHPIPDPGCYQDDPPNPGTTGGG